jgi:hypothetical protein
MEKVLNMFTPIHVFPPHLRKICSVVFKTPVNTFSYNVPVSCDPKLNFCSTSFVF